MSKEIYSLDSCGDFILEKTNEGWWIFQGIEIYGKVVSTKNNRCNRRKVIPLKIDNGKYNWRVPESVLREFLVDVIFNQDGHSGMAQSLADLYRSGFQDLVKQIIEDIFHPPDPNGEKAMSLVKWVTTKIDALKLFD